MKTGKSLEVCMNRTLNNLLLGVMVVLFAGAFISWNMAADEQANAPTLAVSAALYFFMALATVFVILVRPEDKLKRVAVSFLKKVC